VRFGPLAPMAFLKQLILWGGGDSSLQGNKGRPSDTYRT